MSFFEYLPHEYSFACSLAYIYDLSPYDSMIFNMVSEQYPREEEDDDTSATEDEESEGADAVLTVSAQPLESSTSDIPFVFGSFESPIQPFSNPLVEPKFDGFSIKIGEISCAIIDYCCTIVNNDNSMFVDSQDEKLQVLETELKICNSDFVVSGAPEVFVTSSPVRLYSAVYGIVAVKLLTSSSFVGKQSEQPVSTINNQFRFFKLHDVSIVDFDPGGGIVTCLLLSVFTVLRQIQFRLCWIPWDRGRHKRVSNQNEIKKSAFFIIVFGKSCFDPKSLSHTFGKSCFGPQWLQLCVSKNWRVLLHNLSFLNYVWKYSVWNCVWVKCVGSNGFVIFA
jgi:hypothetical protein